ncbi:MAG: GC-type dockerin domain-anchored protein [Planctomycetota bacterium]
MRMHNNNARNSFAAAWVMLIARAATAAPSVVQFGGNLQLGPASTTLFEIGGDQLGAFDRFEVSGNVVIEGFLGVATVNGYALEPGRVFEIIDVGGMLTGAFRDQPEGSLVGIVDNVPLFITYAAGDGNDVALFTDPDPTGASTTTAYFGGDVIFGTQSTAVIEIAGATSFDRFEVAGDVTILGSLHVVPLGGFTLRAGQAFEIIDVGGQQAGAFQGAPEGATVATLNGIDLFITYVAGDGNDTALYTAPAEPDDSGRVTRFDGDVILGVGSTLVVEIEGSALDAFDRIEVGGDLSILGQLDVQLVGGYLPAPGDTFEIIRVDGASSGEFVGLDEGRGVRISPDLALFVSYQAGDGNEVLLTAGIVDPADLDLNGVVNDDDTLTFVNSLTAGDPEADLDQSGSLDLFDLVAFMGLFDQATGGAVPQGASASIDLTTSLSSLTLRPGDAVHVTAQCSFDTAAAGPGVFGAPGFYGFAGQLALSGPSAANASISMPEVDAGLGFGSTATLLNGAQAVELAGGRGSKTPLAMGPTDVFTLEVVVDPAAIDGSFTLAFAGAVLLSVDAGLATFATSPTPAQGLLATLPLVFTIETSNACAFADITTTGQCVTGSGEGVIDLSDFSCYLSEWASGTMFADITTTGVCTPGVAGDGVDLSDFSCYLSEWSGGCP